MPAPIEVSTLRQGDYTSCASLSNKGWIIIIRNMSYKLKNIFVLFSTIILSIFSIVVFGGAFLRGNGKNRIERQILAIFLNNLRNNSSVDVRLSV